MKIARWLLSVAIAAAVLAAVYRIPAQEYRCNIDKQRIRRLVRQLPQLRRDFDKQDVNRIVTELANRCLQETPADYELYLLRGIAQESAGLLDAAEASYRAGLELNERPEFWAYLGAIQIQRGRLDEGLASITKASMFNAEAFSTIDEPTRAIIRKTLREQHERLGIRRYIP